VTSPCSAAEVEVLTLGRDPRPLLEGVSARAVRAYYLVESEGHLRYASTASCGGGLGLTRRILSLHVDRRLDCEDPERFAYDRAAELGLPEPLVALLTGVENDRVRVARARLPGEGGLSAVALVTAGGRNISAAGRSPIAHEVTPGTINVVAIVEGRLTDAALLNLLTVATEAKCLALALDGVRLPDGVPATGTSSDAVVVAATDRGASFRYGGPVTVPGHLVGAAVLGATRAALANSRIGREP